ncbi:MAG: hypothetical protein HY508_07335 [Acidobacteria bacterium]|nr:hypothetical protein [Acidobacteriota bacterium]
MTPNAAAAGSRKSTLLGAAALGLPALFLLLHLWGLPAKLRYPGELNFVEGMPLAEMVHLRQGVPIYAPVSAERYDAANFGPFYYLVGSQLIDPAQPAYLPLRALSLAGTMAAALLAALMAYGLARSRPAAALAALLFLSYGFVIRHGASARSDMVALAIVFAGFAVAHRFRAGRAILWGVPLMVVGFYYKQQFVAGPVAVFIYLLVERRFRLAAQFAGLMTAGVLAGFALCQFVIFRGQAFVHHFVFYNVIPFEVVSLISGMGFFALILFVPLLVSLEYLKNYPDRLFLTYLISAFLLSLVTVARAGSDTYYFLECALICSILFSALLARRISEPGRAPELLTLLVVTLFVGQWFRTPAPSARDFQEDSALQAFLTSRFPRGTRTLSYHSGDVIRAGLALPFTNLYHYNQLIRNGVVDGQEMPGLITQRHFGLILLDFDLHNEPSDYYAEFYLTRAIRDSICTHYHQVETIDMPGPERIRDYAKLYVWVPNSESAADSSGPAPAP